MTAQIDIQALTDRLNKQLENRRIEADNKRTDAREKLLANTDTNNTKELLELYEYYNFKRKKLNDYNFKHLIMLAKLFNKMAIELSDEFKGTVVDMEDFTITFEWPGRSLSWPIKMLAARYNLHAGMFGFDSSFSRHEVYTEDNCLFHIGETDIANKIKISFGDLNNLPEYIS